MARSSWGSGGYGGGWQPYVSVAERRKQAEQEVAKLRKKGRAVTPVTITGQRITTTFWGKAWCDNLESYSDYATRLPRGRSYVRNGSVVHLGLSAGKVDALVHGSSMYTVELEVKPIARARWSTVVDECSGQIASLVELLGGKLSKHVMQVVTSRDRGLFPSPEEISLDCSCPDFANMCKHVAAVMYGIGSRLDLQPELLFLLRNVDPKQLIAKSVDRAATKAKRPRAQALPDHALAGIFGIELDDGPAPPLAPPKAPRARKATTRGR